MTAEQIKNMIRAAIQRADSIVKTGNIGPDQAMNLVISATALEGLLKAIEAAEAEERPKIVIAD